MEESNRFAQEYLQPKILNLHRNEGFDPEIYKMMGELNFLGCAIDFDGNEAVSHTAYGLINREFERVDSAFRTMVSVQNSLVIWPIDTYGTEEAKAKYLPKLVSGDFIGCFGLTEPDHGSDPGGLETRAKKDVKKIVYKGKKLCFEWFQDLDL